MDRRRSIEEILDEARASYARIEPLDARRAAEAGALLVDIRPLELRRQDGTIPGALVVGRNVLEWRLDPTGAHRLPEIVSYDQVVIVFCDEGYASSLAAVALRQLGLHEATDLVGGFQAWKATGLPVDPPAPEA